MYPHKEHKIGTGKVKIYLCQSLISQAQSHAASQFFGQLLKSMLVMIQLETHGFMWHLPPPFQRSKIGHQFYRLPI